MTTPSDDMVITDSGISRQEFELLQQEVQALKAKLRNRDFELTGHLGQVGAASLYSPHPVLTVDLIEIGRDFFRGEQGFLQVKTAGSAQGFRTLVFVNEFARDLDSLPSTYAFLEGHGDGFTSWGAFDTENSTYINITADDRVILLSPSATLDSLTADPSTLGDGQLWYRSDTNVFHGRVNSTTETFAFLSDIPTSFDSDDFTGTEWTDLTDGGETTLHTHAGGGGVSGPLETTYPDVSVASSASANTFGSWVELSADVGTNKQLAYIAVLVRTTLAVAQAFEIEIGEGAAASETPITAVGGIATGGDDFFYLPCPIDLTDNARLSARVKDQEAASNTVSVMAIIMDVS